MSSGNSEGGDVTRINTAIIASVIAALKTNQGPISNAPIDNVAHIGNAPIGNAAPDINLDNILAHIPYLGFIDFEDRLFQLLKGSLTDRINEVVQTATAIKNEKKSIMDGAEKNLRKSNTRYDTAKVAFDTATTAIDTAKTAFETAKKEVKTAAKELATETKAFETAKIAFNEANTALDNILDIQSEYQRLITYKPNFYETIPKNLNEMDTTEKQVYANMSTIDKIKNRQTSYIDTYTKYFVAYKGRQKIYKDAVRVETIDRARFEEFAFIDHHDEYDRSIMGKQSGGFNPNIPREKMEVALSAAKRGATTAFNTTKQGVKQFSNQPITTARNAIPTVGRRIGDIRKAESNGAVYYSGKTNVRDVIRLDNFNFTRYCNGYVWFLAAWIYSPELGYFHLKDLDIREPNSVNPRFFWNFTKEIQQKVGPPIKTFRYFNTSNVLIGDKKDDKIQLYETDGNGSKIYKPVSLLKDEYLNEIGVPKTEDNAGLISDINQRCTVLSQGSFDSTFDNNNSLFDWNIPDSVYYPEKYKFDTKITPDLGVPYFMMGCLTPDKDVIFYPHLDRGQYLFFMSKDDYMKEMDYMDSDGDDARRKAEDEEEARRKAAEDKAMLEAATKTITNFLTEKIKAIKSRKRAEEEARRKADEDKKTAVIVAAIEKRKQETAEQLDAARKKAKDSRRREQEEEERRRREQYEEERNKIAAIVAVDEKRKQEAEADAERRRQKLRDIAASIITKNIKKFLEKKKEEARQREEKRKREEEEERKKAAAAAAAIEQERLRLEKERLERLEKERLERERLEKERLERLRREEERLEKERLEKERLEKERLERLEKERLRKEEEERQEAERRRKEEEERKILAAILAAISQTQTVAKNPQTIFDFIDVFFVGNTEIIKKAVNNIRDILKYHFIYKQLNSYYITLIPSNSNQTDVLSNMNNIRKIRDGIKNETIVKIDDVNKSYDEAKKTYDELLTGRNSAKINDQQINYFINIKKYQNYIISFITKYVEITKFFDNNTVSLVNINNVDDILSNIKDNSNKLYPLLKDLLVLEREIQTDIDDTDKNTKDENVNNQIKISLDARGKRLTIRNTGARKDYKGNYLNRRLNILRDIYKLFSEKNKVFIENVGSNSNDPGWDFKEQARGKQIKEFLPYISHGWFTAFFELMTGKIDTDIKSVLNKFDEYEKDNLNKNNIKKIDIHSGIEKSIQENLDKLNKININTESGITEYITVINKTKQDIFSKIQSGCDRYIIKTEESDKIIQDIHDTTKYVKEFAVGKPNLGTGYNDTNYQTTSHVFSHFEKQPAQNTNLNDELKTQGFTSFIPSTSNDYPLEMGQYLEHVYQQYDNENTVTDTHYLYLIPQIREQLLKLNRLNKIKIMSHISSRFPTKKQIENTTSDQIIIGNDDYDDQIGTYTNDVLFDLESICSEIDQGSANPIAGKDIKDDVLITGRKPPLK